MTERQAGRQAGRTPDDQRGPGARDGSNARAVEGIEGGGIDGQGVDGLPLPNTEASAIGDGRDEEREAVGRGPRDPVVDRPDEDADEDADERNA